MPAVYTVRAGRKQDMPDRLRAEHVPRPKALYATPQLERLRLARMLTQSELAMKAQVARTAIIRLEAGGVARRSTIRKLAKFLEVEPEDLLAELPQS